MVEDEKYEEQGAVENHTFHPGIVRKIHSTETSCIWHKTDKRVKVSEGSLSSRSPCLPPLYPEVTSDLSELYYFCRCVL